MIYMAALTCFANPKSVGCEVQKWMTGSPLRMSRPKG